jgi:hypothetical protein
MGSEKKKDTANPLWLQRLLVSLKTPRHGPVGVGSMETFPNTTPVAEISWQFHEMEGRSSVR